MLEPPAYRVLSSTHHLDRRRGRSTRSYVATVSSLGVMIIVFAWTGMVLPVMFFARLRSPSRTANSCWHRIAGEPRRGYRARLRLWKALARCAQFTDFDGPRRRRAIETGTGALGWATKGPQGLSSRSRSRTRRRNRQPGPPHAPPLRSRQRVPSSRTSAKGIRYRAGLHMWQRTAIGHTT